MNKLIGNSRNNML